jgi:4'-phosphopantetheinyl transferase
MFCIVYYTWFPTPLPAGRFAALLAPMPESVRQKVLSYRRWQDAHASLLSKHLLLYAFSNAGETVDLASLQYTPEGRPFLPGKPDFNLSHSGTLAVCVVAGKGRIGIDVEYWKPIDIHLLKDNFTAEEWRHIKDAASPEKTFYDYWTRKEAILKADGRGLSVPPSDVRIAGASTGILYGKRWYLTAVEGWKEYSCCIATDMEELTIRLQPVNFSI